MTGKTGSLRLLPWGFLGSTTAIVCVCSVAGFLGRLWWPFDLASHFRVQYFFFLLTSGIIFLLAKRKKGAALSGVFAVINVSLLVPLYFGGSFAHGSRQTFRAVFINVNYSNRAYGKFEKFIRSAKPDFMILAEVSNAWASTLRQMQADYPFSRNLAPRKGRSDIALLSRIPIASNEVAHVGATKLPSIVARLEIEGQSLTVVGAHAVAPWNRIRSKLHNQHLAALGQIVNSQAGSVMVLADLNTTSWSPYFQDMLRKTRLRDSRIGLGIQPTWPTGFPPLWIAIDHCLVSSGVVVRNRKIGPDIGSDHYPVIIDFSIQPG